MTSARRGRTLAPVAAAAAEAEPAAAPAWCSACCRDWERIKTELSAYDDARETVIKRSREIGKAGKQAIYCLHRGQQKEAAARLAAAEAVAAELAPILEANPTLRTGSYTNAVEEYAEARVFLGFLSEKRLASVAELSDKLALSTEEYLGGVLDFSGELNRWAIARATARDKAAVAQCRDLVDAIMGKFLDMDLRNGPLRRKFDALKYTLKVCSGWGSIVSPVHAAWLAPVAEHPSAACLPAEAGDDAV